jgi:hypothetical protein
LSERDAWAPAAVINANERLYFKGEDPVERILVQEIVPGKTRLGDEIPWKSSVWWRTKGRQPGRPRRQSGMHVSNEQSPVFFQSRWCAPR